MYPRGSWELVADPLGQAEHTLRSTVLQYDCKTFYYFFTPPTPTPFPYLTFWNAQNMYKCSSAQSCNVNDICFFFGGGRRNTEFLWPPAQAHSSDWQCLKNTELSLRRLQNLRTEMQVHSSLFSCFHIRSYFLCRRSAEMHTYLIFH